MVLVLSSTKLQWPLPKNTPQQLKELLLRLLENKEVLEDLAANREAQAVVLVVAQELVAEELKAPRQPASHAEVALGLEEALLEAMELRVDVVVQGVEEDMVVPGLEEEHPILVEGQAEEDQGLAAPLVEELPATQLSTKRQQVKSLRFRR